MIKNTTEIRKSKMPNGKTYYQVYYNDFNNKDWFQVGLRGVIDKINFNTKKQSLEVEKMFNNKSKRVFKIRL